MASGSFLSAASTQAGTAPEYASIKGKHSGMCLDDTNGSGSSGNQMQIWGCNGLANQGWHVWDGKWCNSHQGSPTLCGAGIGFPVAFVMLQNQKSGLCLNLMGGANAGNGAAVAQWPCNANDQNQWWELFSTGTSTYYIYKNFGDVGGGDCMTVSADSVSAGAKVQGWMVFNGISGCESETDNSYFWTAGPLGSMPA